MNRSVQFFVRCNGTDEVAAHCGGGHDPEEILQGIVNVLRSDVQMLCDGKLLPDDFECSIEVREMTDEEVAALPEL